MDGESNIIEESENENGRITITELAKKIGVTPKTLVRWEKSGKIRKPKRDWKGWRIYDSEDVAHVERIVNAVYEF